MMNEELRASALAPPGATVSVKPTGRRIPFSPTPNYSEKPIRPWVPVSLRRRAFTFDASRSPTENAEANGGLFWVKILQPCVVGVGKMAEIGDLVQLSGEYAMSLVCGDFPQAEFVPDQKSLQEEQQIQELKRKGFKIQTPMQKMTEQESYVALQEAKKGKPRWPVLDTDA